MKTPEQNPIRGQPQIVVEFAHPEDAEAIVKIQAATWLETYPNEEYGITVEDIKVKKLDSPRSVQHWKATIEEAGSEYQAWVAKQGTDLVGYCLVRRGESEQYINALYITSLQQGKGVGQLLMKEALSWLGESKPIGLGVAIYNKKAIAFYKKNWL